MQFVKSSEAVSFSNSSKCRGIEYPLQDKEINFSIAKITGRYPEHGFCVNEECKELIYVMEGSGNLYIKDSSEVISFEQGDVILIDRKEIYFWDADCTIMMPCTPAWYEGQHKLID